MRAFLYIAKIKMMEALEYRFEFLTGTFIEIIIMLANMFFWKAAYSGKDTVNGVSLNNMLVYSVLSVLMGCVIMQTVEQNLRSRVRQGNIAVDFIKPMNIFTMFIAQDVGNIVIALIQRFLPLIIFSCIFIVVPIPASILHLVLFIISCILSFFIIWIIGAIMGLFYFWVIDLGPLGSVKDMIISFLSGAVIPLWFFPEWIQKFLYALPFVYIYQMPISIFIGKLSILESIRAILIQTIWAVLFFIAFFALQKKTTKNVLVQGG